MNHTVCVQTAKQRVDTLVAVLRKASGINTNQAKTCLYYAAATYLQADLLPILVIIGKAGTGKSSLMKQLKGLVNKPHWTNAKTSAALRTELSKREYFTVFIEEGDKVDEDLLASRYDTETAKIAVRIEGENGWRNTDLNIFGATVIHRRVPLSDLALRSRAIFIPTDYHPGNYEIQNVDRKQVREIARLVGEVPKTSHRVENTWEPLIAVAEAVRDEEWLKYAQEQISQDKQALVTGQTFEPDKALIYTIRALMIKEIGGVTVAEPVLLRKIKDEMRYNYDLNLKVQQIDQMCTKLGFEVTYPQGYPTVNPNLELIKNLIVEQSNGGKE
jgi:energy-coupling factor transporter ATP-binding protein EcfA2